MATDRHRLHVLRPQRASGTAGLRLSTSVSLYSVALASLLGCLLTSGPVQFTARVTLSALVVGGGGKEVVRVLRDVRAHDWRRMGRAAWLQYPALAVGVLLILMPGYALLVILYPALQSSTMTRVFVAIAMGLLVLCLALLALALLALVGMLLAVPVLIVRSLARERRRRSYHLPGR